VVKTFGDFEFDDRRRRLRAGGQAVRLSGQALDVLCLLLERPGELITREEIERRLWPDRTVDFHHSLDVVFSRLRTVLGDKGPSPRYIETVPRKGYRFIEPVIARPDARPVNKPRHWSRPLLVYVAVAILAAILAILFARTRYDKLVPSQRSLASPTVPAVRSGLPFPARGRAGHHEMVAPVLPRIEMDYQQTQRARRLGVTGRSGRIIPAGRESVVAVLGPSLVVFPGCRGHSFGCVGTPLPVAIQLSQPLL
jgi:DNA-binding winged helix-turn-helix (wHTH) protein